MTVLIVEDDRNKELALHDVVRQQLPLAEVLERRSYQSGLDAALTSAPEIIVLDMSMPNYDVSPTESDYNFLHYAGRDILRELKRKRIRSVVIVVTQFETFGEDKEMTTLEELKVNLAAQFAENYVRTIYYHPAQTNWRDELADALALAASRAGSGD